MGRWKSGVLVKQFGAQLDSGQPWVQWAVFGQGLEHVESSLPGGQPSPGVYGYPSAVNVGVYLIDGTHEVPLRFAVHISGSCGHAFTQAWPEPEGRGAQVRTRAAAR